MHWQYVSILSIKSKTFSLDTQITYYTLIVGKELLSLAVLKTQTSCKELILGWGQKPELNEHACTQETLTWCWPCELQSLCYGCVAWHSQRQTWQCAGSFPVWQSSDSRWRLPHSHTPGHCTLPLSALGWWQSPGCCDEHGSQADSWSRPHWQTSQALACNMEIEI